ncbi:MAG: MiaB/RimO family radical SAM methylthiotransferase, partial [Eubacteriales bacterium]|nr:MiaB/RimO family radical SAM methylthiotransferase [Eubacteriales bacterium]
MDRGCLMKTIAFTTLGCKVNEYDTQAMRELFEAAGWQSVPFSQEADVYLINTCTVTSTGDGKSMKTIRRTAREHPQAELIVTGCLAQKDAERVAVEGVRLVIGSARRGEVVSLLARAREQGKCLVAVESLKNVPFERLQVGKHEEKTRAVMKIQEGCDRYCAYCIIPYVRGPVRSMPLEDVRAEAARLAQAGYKEIVLTGIHLASYGRGTEDTLIDAIRAVSEPEGVARVRLGSLEPLLITPEFLAEAVRCEKICPQFHLSMQSGSAGVLRRMNRRYTPGQYEQACALLREAFPGCAITTDVITGFPGETEEEYLETEEFVKKIG